MVFMEVIEEKKAKFSLWFYNITTKYKNTAGGHSSPLQVIHYRYAADYDRAWIRVAAIVRLSS
jgi:hypothetical protein